MKNNLERLGATAAGENGGVSEGGFIPTGDMKCHGVPMRPRRMGMAVDAEILMELAWENPLLDEEDCAILYSMIKQAQKETEE